MKLLVCVSKTPDTTAKIEFAADNTVFEESGVSFIMNPYDEWYALVRALELKEATGGSVSILNVGPADNDPVIRKGLAIGADKAVRINGQPSSSLYVARQIAAHAQKEGYDLIFFGKETIDYNGSEVGAMVAELLDMPYISYATKLELAGTQAHIVRDIEGGEEQLSVSAPFVISAAKGLAEQRIPNMRGIMMAKSKPLVVEEAIEVEEVAKIVHYEKPAAKTGVKLIDPDNMDELVRLLHEEAKVI